MNLRIPIGFITLIIAMIMSAFVVFDLTRHMGKTNDGIIEALLDTRGYPEPQQHMPFANKELTTNNAANMEGDVKPQHHDTPFANKEPTTNNAANMEGDVKPQHHDTPFANKEPTTNNAANMEGDAERQNCWVFLKKGSPKNYIISKYGEHKNALCFVKDLDSPISKVDLKIDFEQFGANETSEIEIKYKLLNGDNLRKNFAKYKKNCIFGKVDPIVENSVEMSKFLCFASELAYTNFYANIIADRRFIERKSGLLKDDDELKKILYFGWESCLWSENYYASLNELLKNVFHEKNYPEIEAFRQVELLGGLAFVYDAVKFNTFNTIELIISRYQQTLRVFEDEKNLEDKLHKLAAIQLRSNAYSLLDSLMLLDYILESIKKISKEYEGFVKEGSISAAVAGTREVHVLNFSIMDSLNNSTFRKNNIFTKQKFTWTNYIDIDRNVTETLQHEISAAWESPKTSMKEDLEMLWDLLKMLKTRLGTGQTSILVKGMSLDKASSDGVRNIMKSIYDRILWLQLGYISAITKFDGKISDFCKNIPLYCLSDVHEYESMPNNPMKGKVALEKHRSAYEEALVYNDTSTAPASNPSTT
ncbi:uncharacterized protein NEMAJ01_1647 [Nematocida major]|uniref:uncharacterized protein n=1 Tax=Nematocida major TaxID=1912982 RepID=UPI00200776AA|nr:uncharacterized protein NEMAJ01_1647 [Nematocida major]KAH9386751.1 hypothetical protein NEMAJ01_1647 [Nematocida major]